MGETQSVSQRVIAALQGSRGQDQALRRRAEEMASALEDPDFVTLSSVAAQRWADAFQLRLRDLVSGTPAQTEGQHQAVSEAQNRATQYSNLVKQSAHLSAALMEAISDIEAAHEAIAHIDDCTAKFKSRKLLPSEAVADELTQSLNKIEMARTAATSAVRLLGELHAIMPEGTSLQRLTRGIREKSIDPDFVLGDLRSALQATGASPKLVEDRAEQQPATRSSTAPAGEARPAGHQSAMSERQTRGGSQQLVNGRHPRHARFGDPMNSIEIAISAENFFRAAFEAGLDEMKLGDLLYARSARLDGLNVHDALAYSAAVPLLYEAMPEFMERFRKPRPVPAAVTAEPVPEPEQEPEI